MRQVMDTIIEIYLSDPTGMRIECLDYVTEYEYTLIANEPGAFKLKMPFTFDRRNVKLDNIIEIWRGHGPGTLKLELCGFLRAWEFGDVAGMDYTNLYGYSVMELLERRIVMDYGGATMSELTDYADDMCKAIVIDQMGADASATRDLTSVGGGFTVAADLSDCDSITKEMEYKNVLQVCQEIAATSKQLGTDLYFDVVPRVSSSTTGMLGFQFQTFTGQRGNDRTWDSGTPVYIGLDWGNLENGLMFFDYRDEKNFCYALGPGTGADQDVLTVTDTARAEKTIWNLCEGTKNASGVTAGSTAELTAEANEYLDDHKPKMKFTGSIVETPAFRYGHDWGFGDLVTIVYAGMQYDAMINKVNVKRDESGQETITAKFEITE